MKRTAALKSGTGCFDRRGNQDRNHFFAKAESQNIPTNDRHYLFQQRYGVTTLDFANSSGPKVTSSCSFGSWSAVPETRDL
jgi:hypothetical protein